jgi:hypothetical protein
LHESGQYIGKTHDLLILLDQVIETEPFWASFREDLAYLSTFSVIYRYPGESADRTMAQKARGYIQTFRAAARQALIGS